MSTPWIVAFCVLAAAVAAVAIVLLGLMRSVLETLTTVQAALANTNPDFLTGPGLRVGDPAPTLPPPGTSAEHGALIVFVEAGCEPCQLLVADIASRRFHPVGYTAYAVLDNPAAFASQLPHDWTAVPDPHRHLQATWQIPGTPRAYLVGFTGSILAAGYPNTVRDLRRLIGSDRPRTHHHGEAVAQ